MNVMDAIYGRSSVRNYKNEQIPEEDIREILKAGFHAPNGMNCQSIRFVVIQDPKYISELNTTVKVKLLASEHAQNYPQHILASLNDPKSSVFHGAPTLIFLFSTPEVATPTEDGALAVGNMMLAAYSMGYGTCFVGFAGVLGEDDEFRKKCDIPKDYIYQACMLLGKPNGTIEKHPRGDVKILKWIK